MVNSPSLRGLDHTKYTFGAITVEHNFQDASRQEVHAFLASKGYERVVAGAEDACVVERVDRQREGLCAGAERGVEFCPCVDDFYVFPHKKK